MINNDEIKRISIVHAPSDGMKCELCSKPVPGRAEVVRIAEPVNGKWDIKFYGKVCCGFKV